ncbi:MAG: hypothetical protein CL967_04435 [Euryarchaeota archaeon]|nr:hypothetical protein [Euryarchaeota archaeon]
MAALVSARRATLAVLAEKPVVPEKPEKPAEKPLRGRVLDQRTFYSTTLCWTTSTPFLDARYIVSPQLYDMGEGTPSSAMMCKMYPGVSHPNYTTNGMMVVPKDNTLFTTCPVYTENDTVKSTTLKHDLRPLLEEYHTCPLHERLGLSELLSDAPPSSAAFAKAVTKARAWTMIWEAQFVGGRGEEKNEAKWRWRSDALDSPDVKALLLRAGAQYPLSEETRRFVSDTAKKATMLNEWMDVERSRAQNKLYVETMSAFEGEGEVHPGRWQQKWQRFYRKHGYGNLAVSVVPEKWPMLKDGETTRLHQRMFGPAGQPKREDFEGDFSSMIFEVAKALTKARLWDVLRDHEGSFMFTHLWWQEILYKAAGTDFGFSGAAFGFTMREMQAIARRTPEEAYEEAYDKDTPVLKRKHNLPVPSKKGRKRRASTSTTSTTSNGKRRKY